MNRPHTVAEVGYLLDSGILAETINSHFSSQALVEATKGAPRKLNGLTFAHGKADIAGGIYDTLTLNGDLSPDELLTIKDLAAPPYNYIEDNTKLNRYSEAGIERPPTPLGFAALKLITAATDVGIDIERHHLPPLFDHLNTLGVVGGVALGLLGVVHYTQRGYQTRRAAKDLRSITHHALDPERGAIILPNEVIELRSLPSEMIQKIKIAPEEYEPRHVHSSYLKKGVSEILSLNPAELITIAVRVADPEGITWQDWLKDRASRLSELSIRSIELTAERNRLNELRKHTGVRDGNEIRPLVQLIRENDLRLAEIALEISDWIVDRKVQNKGIEEAMARSAEISELLTSLALSQPAEPRSPEMKMKLLPLEIIVHSAFQRLPREDPQTIQTIEAVINYLASIRPHLTTAEDVKRAYVGLFNKFSASLIIPPWEDVSDYFANA